MHLSLSPHPQNSVIPPHPQFNGIRTAIKQTLKPTGPLPQPFFPPKWGLQVAKEEAAAA
jgi:hypothetical protein